MTPLRQIPRLVRIAAVLVRYRLDDLVDAAHLYRPLKLVRVVLPRPRGDIAHASRGARLVMALTELGPIFVKFGQILSTRRDLLPPDVADELTTLQDRVAPFPEAAARAAIEQALGAPIAERYASFDGTPLASASIAQVHAATLKDGREVVVKVLRPISASVSRPMSICCARSRPRSIAFIRTRTKIRARDVVAEVETTLVHELDLMREGANASLLRRNFLGSDDLYVPEVIWSHTNERVLTLERVRGIPVDDLAAIDAGRHRSRAARRERRAPFLHAGVPRQFFPRRCARGQHLGRSGAPVRSSLDRARFRDHGLACPKKISTGSAENSLRSSISTTGASPSFTCRAGWMPQTTRLDELEAAVRTVCEPYFTRPAFRYLAGRSRRQAVPDGAPHELTLQPQLILLQKTLLNIEGVGRLLHPQIDNLGDRETRARAYPGASGVDRARR